MYELVFICRSVSTITKVIATIQCHSPILVNSTARLIGSKQRVRIGDNINGIEWLLTIRKHDKNMIIDTDLV